MNEPYSGQLSKQFLKEQIRQIERTTPPQRVEDFNRAARNKVLALNAIFFISIALYKIMPNTLMGCALVLVNGTFAVPYLRVFIHSEMHWGLLKNKKYEPVFRALAFSIYHVPFEAYKYGHFAHHRYDNDRADGSFAKDKQSTYLTSEEGRPINWFLWMLHYLFIYQFYYQTKLVLDSGVKKAKKYLAIQVLVIVAIDSAILLLSPSFFWYVYLPSLAVAWIGSGIVLYMMHKVEVQSAAYHHSVNSYSKFFNSFGDNDGLHIVHSMFPSLHPMHASKVDTLIKPELHHTQVLRRHYVSQFFIDLFKRN